MTIEERALDLINEVRVEFRLPRDVRLSDTYRNTVPVHEALCRVIEQLRAEREAHAAAKAEHEAFRRDVSDELERCSLGDFAKERLSRFILPKPVEPLVAVMAFNSLDTATAEQRAANLREDAKALGYEIKLVEVGDAD